MDKSSQKLHCADIARADVPGWQPNSGSTGETGRVTRSGSGDRRLIRRSGGLLAAGVTLALGLAAVGVRAAAGAALHGPGLAVGWSVGLALLFAAVTLSIASKYRGHVSANDVPTASLDRLRQATIAVLFTSAALVPITLIVLHRPTPGIGSTLPPTTFPPSPLAKAGSPGGQVQPTRAPARGHHFAFDLTALLWALAAGLGIALAIGLAAFAIRMLRKLPQTGPTASAAPIAGTGDEDEALSGALLAGRSALAGDDARAAIIACYAAMEVSLGSVGVARELADSPSDLLRRANSGSLPGTGARDAAALTDLFREARYSTHPLTAQHLAAARAALDSVTAALAERIRAREAEAARAAAVAEGAKMAARTEVSAP